jgi:hypothetical protein
VVRGYGATGEVDATKGPQVCIYDLRHHHSDASESVSRARL